MEILEVLSASIRYMKEFLLDSLKRHEAEIDVNAWVITVPAIWGNRAKQIMRRAAEKVRINYYVLDKITDINKKHD